MEQYQSEGFKTAEGKLALAAYVLSFVLVVVGLLFPDRPWAIACGTVLAVIEGVGFKTVRTIAKESKQKAAVFSGAIEAVDAKKNSP